MKPGNDGGRGGRAEPATMGRELMALRNDRTTHIHDAYARESETRRLTPLCPDLQQINNELRGRWSKGRYHVVSLSTGSKPVLSFQRARNLLSHQWLVACCLIKASLPVVSSRARNLLSHQELVTSCLVWQMVGGGEEHPSGALPGMDPHKESRVGLTAQETGMWGVGCRV